MSDLYTMRVPVAPKAGVNIAGISSVALRSLTTVNTVVAAEATEVVEEVIVPVEVVEAVEVVQMDADEVVNEVTDYSGMKVAELKKLLGENGVEFAKSATKTELLELVTTI